MGLAEPLRRRLLRHPIAFVLIWQQADRQR
jgi:hypothetical protein